MTAQLAILAARSKQLDVARRADAADYKRRQE
jgi:hypothetical protein